MTAPNPEGEGTTVDGHLYRSAPGGAFSIDMTVREDGRTRLSKELYPDVAGEILLACLERQDLVARATAWLRAERSWRHPLAPLLEVG